MRTTYTIPQSVANSYLVRERGRRFWHDCLLLLGIVLPVAVGMLGYVWVRAELVRTGYRVHALEDELERKAQVERQLRLEASYLASPQRIERLATGELQMRPPVLDQVVFLEAQR